MKLMSVLSRLLILLVAGAAFVGLIDIYYEITPRTVFSDAMIKAIGPVNVARNIYESRHEPPAPDVGYVTDFFAYGIMLAVFSYAGRMLFRLRLNPRPRGEGQPILLGLLELRQQSAKSLATSDGHPPTAC